VLRAVLSGKRFSLLVVMSAASFALDPMKLVIDAFARDICDA
jgi:hypothetical protein